MRIAIQNFQRGAYMRNHQTFDREAISHIATLIDTGKIEESCRLLGEGLSGKVYEFEQYAVKVYKENCCENDDHLMLNRLNPHPAFPKIHYREDRFLIVDKVVGHTLGETLKAGEQLDDHTFRKIEKVVEDCYDQGIVACDLHLNNIMIDQDKNVKIVDVGRFFATSNAKQYKEEIQEQLGLLKYHLLFSFSSSGKHKHHKKYFSSSSHKHHYFSSSPHKHIIYSSSPHKHHHFFSSSPHKHKKHHFSWS
jgi:serine/threonine protein kinase